VSAGEPLSAISSEQLREMATLARACLLIESARAYGLITGGPAVDVDRCEEVLEHATERGVESSQDDVDAAAIGILAEVGVDG
jgi:hypothetical protein